ncbi:MAG TPA: aminodeoxychorismate synthase component I [Actinomycetota bacterium]|nr:aminodeoxychorismate synthase component I [Actinomycetota bacterium]
MIGARFDDLWPGAERAFRLAEPVGVLEARRPDEVPGVIESAEAASARGLWVGGFVAYEAAPGLNPDLAVRERTTGDPFADLPFAWFALFERRQAAEPLAPSGADPAAEGSPWAPSVDRDAYDAAVDAIRDLIEAGETYQVNHTIRLRARIAGDDRGFYRDLALSQRGPYAAHLDLGRYRILSASPELFFRIDGDSITTRPMKGTAPRGRWPAEDDEVAARLVASPKDRAENAMIVDLLRNDLGRIARPGTVRVADLFRAERYETVWQLTSTVAAERRPGTSLLDTFRALFPSGSVTGAPKVRTMSVIRDLEDSPRGVYCGAIGYLAPSGSGEPSANFSVAIRTVMFDRRTGTAEYGVGGGITFDSSAEREYAEILAKARVLTAVRPEFELLETMRFEPAEGLRHLAEHLDRLSSSARYFGFRFDPEAVVSELKRAVGDADAELRVRLSLARDGSVRVDTAPAPAGSNGPVRVALDDEPVDSNDVWLFHKTSRRAPYDRRREKRPDVEDVILVNSRGEVTESTIANVAVRLDGRWVTPPVASGLLPGSYRAMLVRDGTLAEERVTVEQLVAAEEIALVSSTRGWRPAVVVP